MAIKNIIQMIQGYTVVNDTDTAALVEAVGKVYEANGRTYEGYGITLEHYGAADIINSASSNLKKIAVDIDEQRCENIMLHKKLEKLSANNLTVPKTKTANEIKMEADLKQAEEETEILRQQADELKSKHMVLIQAIIRRRDEMYLLLDNAKSREEKTAEQLLVSLLDRERQNLKQCGIITLCENGQYDGNLQKVVGTIETEDETICNTVAQTSREGYMYDNTLLRAQEVVIYKIK